MSITDDQSLTGAAVRGHKLRVWDDGLGPLWIYRETLGAVGVVRAQTWEEAYSCVEDEIMGDADMTDEDNRPDADGNLPEGLHWRGSGVPSQEGLESPLAQEDLNGSILEALTAKLAYELEVTVEFDGEDTPIGMPGEQCPVCKKDYDARPVSESCDCEKRVQVEAPPGR